MKSIALSFLVVISACGGNWSNEDLEFMAALNTLPKSEDVQVKLPKGTSGALSGEGTRRDALGLGEPSQLYKDTSGASGQFNGGVLGILKIIDEVRAYPPTSRNKETRTWGPFPDTNNPDFDIRIVLTKIDDTNFRISFDYQNTKTGDPIFSTLKGSFTATKAARHGHGALVLDPEASVKGGLKVDEGLKTISKIEMAYVTDTFPIEVNMKFTTNPGQSVSSLEYSYKELENKSGRVGFRQHLTDPNIMQLDIMSQWLASGAGSGVYTVVEGNYKGATHLECWDAAFKTTFVRQTWPGGVNLGNEADCVKITGFDP